MIDLRRSALIRRGGRGLYKKKDPLEIELIIEVGGLGGTESC